MNFYKNTIKTFYWKLQKQQHNRKNNTLFYDNSLALAVQQQIYNEGLPGLFFAKCI